MSGYKITTPTSDLHCSAHLVLSGSCAHSVDLTSAVHAGWVSLIAALIIFMERQERWRDSVKSVVHLCKVSRASRLVALLQWRIVMAIHSKSVVLLIISI